MKKRYILLVLIFGVSLFSFQAEAQEKEKEVKIKVVKDKNGERTEMDTIIFISGDEDPMDLIELNELLEEEGLEGFDFDVDVEGDENVKVKVVRMDGSDSNQKKVVMVKSGDDELIEIDNEYIISMISSDSTEGGNIMKMSVDGSGQGIFVSDGGEVHEISVGDDGHNVMIFKQGGEEGEMLFDDDAAVWVGDDHSKIEVIEGEDGKKIIVEDKDGIKKEYKIEEGKGTYFIGEDGEMKKVDDDMEWVNEEDGLKKIIVHVDDDSQTIMITEDGETIELKDFDKNHNTFFYDTEQGEGEQEVFVEVIEKKEGNSTIIIKSTIVVQSISEEEISTLEKSGVKVAGDDVEKLEIGKLKFHPNPSDGKFKLEFTTENTGTTEVAIYDINGRKVYNEKITGFKGHYDKEIDISSEKSGTYFLLITQGNKISSRKIILE